MKNVNYLIGSEEINTSPLTAYSDEAVSFITDLSARIMKSAVTRIHPDVTALGFWGRKGNLAKMKENCHEASVRLGRGLCFHIAPSNIPMSFAFSYLFGLLAGCANVVRLPSKPYLQTEASLKIIGETLRDHPEVASRTAFIRYPADNEITGAYSLLADARMIWGGDKTVNSIRSLPIRPKCIDIAFADRYSFCIIDGKAVLDAPDDRINRLAEDFYNDTYLMDQNACSSPQMICWMNDSEAARKRFWAAVFSVAQRKYDLQAAICVDKYTQSCEDAVKRSENISCITRETNLLYRAEVKRLIPGVENYRGKGGYFYEHSMPSIDEIASIVTEKYQTVSYFGVDPEEIRKAVLAQRLKGIDRITPIGKAMDIGVIWDGYDLVRMLSRIVNVE